MADFVENLVDMGFSRDKAQKAVEVTGNIGVETAMEWILSHPDEPELSQTQPQQAEVAAENVDKAPLESATAAATAAAAAAATAAAAAAAAEVVRSYKCDDCGKQFRNAEEMEFHAAKTNHSNFSESTEEKRALTAEEKQEQFKRIEEKLKQKRAEREEREKKEEIEREKVRVRSGKELAEAKRRIEEQEMKDIAEARRREKIEDRMARDRVKAQIEADKIARKAKFGATSTTSESAASSSSLLLQQPQSTTNANSDLVSPPKKDYKETKLQLRLPSGKTLVQTFGANEPLASVRLYVELNRTDGLSGSFKLMTSFPKRVYEEDEYDIPLEALGLVPSAVLMITKAI